LTVMVNDAIALYKTLRFGRIFQKIEIRNPDRKQFLQGLQYQRITPYPLEGHGSVTSQR
jgi:hypothetical protein